MRHCALVFGSSLIFAGCGGRAAEPPALAQQDARDVADTRDSTADADARDDDFDGKLPAIDTSFEGGCLEGIGMAARDAVPVDDVACAARPVACTSEPTAHAAVLSRVSLCLEIACFACKMLRIDVDARGCVRRIELETYAGGVSVPNDAEMTCALDALATVRWPCIAGKTFVQLGPSCTK